MSTKVLMLDNDRSNFDTARKSSWPVVLACALFACSSPSNPSSQSEITLTVEKVSDSDTAVVITNGSESTIHVRGERGLLGAVRMHVPDAIIACRTRAALLQEEPASITSSATNDIEIQSGESLNVIVETTLPQQSRGGRCVVSLQLTDGRIIGPFGFSP